VLATALSLAFFLGAAHALTPGHGKVIVAAYLAGSKGRVYDAVLLGAVVTLTHTASVFVIGLAALYASQRISLDRIYPWMALASGTMVTGIGGWLVWRRWRARRHDHDHEVHEHHHNHRAPHRHERPGMAGLFSLGISGGLVPCPEALVILMVSIALRRVALGLAVLVSFSLGLAAVIIAIGAAMVVAAPAMRRLTGDAPWLRALPLASAAVVTALGVAMMVQAALR
jgi:ABC-type nickel/cobalt efflux system permease component RcnA